MDEPDLDLPTWAAEPLEAPELPSLSPLPEEEKEESVFAESKYLVIGLAGTDYAVALHHVLEIDYPRAITPLPHLPEWLLGICQVRGDILSVIDLPGLLNLERVRPNRSSRLLVVRGGPDQLIVGLLVEYVRAIVRFPADSLVPPAELAAGVLGSYLGGVMNQSQRQLPMLDLERLLQGPELRQL